MGRKISHRAQKWNLAPAFNRNYAGSSPVGGTNKERIMTYEEAKKIRDGIEHEVSRFSIALKSFPRGPMGLTPDTVKASAEWKNAKQGYDATYRKLQNFNSILSKHFDKEIKADRDARRKLKPASIK